jgi:hypothetical protein
MTVVRELVDRLEQVGLRSLKEGIKDPLIEPAGSGSAEPCASHDKQTVIDFVSRWGFVETCPFSAVRRFRAYTLRAEGASFGRFSEGASCKLQHPKGVFSV